MNTAKPQRIAWLDSLKFLACLAILWGHFFGIFRPETLAAPVRQIVKACGALEMSCFWVPLFCVISGGLVRYHAGTGILRALAHRYWRFAAPFAIAGLAIWGWLQILPAETQAYGARLGNDWLATMYAAPPTLGDVLAMARVFDATLDPPLWMLRDLVLGNVWVLVCGWQRERRGGGRAALALGACAGLAIGVLGLAAELGMLPGGPAGRVRPIAVHAMLVSATIIGALLPVGTGTESGGTLMSAGARAESNGVRAGAADSGQRTRETQAASGRSAGWALGVLIAAAAALTALSRLRGSVPDAATWLTGLALALIVLRALPAAAPVLRILSHPALVRCGALSLPLYLLHAPILVTITLRCYGAALPALGHTAAVMIAALVALGASMIAAQIWLFGARVSCNRE